MRIRKGEDTVLIGSGAKLDSLNLVSLIVDIEKGLSDKLGIEVSLTDENAMSQQKSPFRTVKTLADYICSSKD